MSELPRNKKIDAAVLTYVDQMLLCAEQFNKNLVVEVEYEDMNNRLGTECALAASVRSDHAFVSVFPNFTDDTAAASLLNRGLVSQMLLEGFSKDEIIDSDLPLMGSFVNYSTKNAEMFGAALAKDMGLQHQKGCFNGKIGDIFK
jgi:hypothetical protein